jgi:hypothetical protein
MQVRPEVAGGAQQPFEGETLFSRGHVRFGPFCVAKVDRGWVEGSGGTSPSAFFPEWIKSVTAETEHADFQFVLEEDQQAATRTVRCRADMSYDAVRVGPMTFSNTAQQLHCGLWLGADPDRFARLELLGGRGSVVLGGRTLTIEARDIQGRADAINPAGYALSEGGRDLAVAQTVNGGAAWISRDLDADARSLAASSVAALLLYHPPSPKQ